MRILMGVKAELLQRVPDATEQLFMRYSSWRRCLRSRALLLIVSLMLLQLSHMLNGLSLGDCIPCERGTTIRKPGSAQCLTACVLAAVACLDSFRGTLSESQICWDTLSMNLPSASGYDATQRWLQQTAALGISG